MMNIRGFKERCPKDTKKLRSVVDTFVGIVKSYGAVERDYPVLEKRSNLLDKYGDDEKLIYDITYEGDKESYSMRYDLTTQAMLYATRPSRTFQVGKVFRREAPSVAQKRYREFYQFDYDIIGYRLEYTQVEVLDALKRCLKSIGITDYRLRINNRKIVNMLLEKAGVDEDMCKTTCSTLDKLDKFDDDWLKIEAELKTKGIENPEAVTKTFNDYMKENPDSDPTLIRGLDYYDGMVFEVEYKGVTIAGGGGYGDAIGFSIGLDRILDFLPDLDEPGKLFMVTWNKPEEAVVLANKVREMTKMQVIVVPVKNGSGIKDAFVKFNSTDVGYWFVFGGNDKMPIATTVKLKPVGANIETLTVMELMFQ